MSKPAHQPFLDLREAVYQLAVKAARDGMLMADVAQTLSTLAVDLQFSRRVYKDVTGQNMSHLP